MIKENVLILSDSIIINDSCGFYSRKCILIYKLCQQIHKINHRIMLMLWIVFEDFFLLYRNTLLKLYIVSKFCKKMANLSI